MKLVRVLPLAALVAAISPASAAVSEEDLDQLRREVAALSLRLDELAVENAMLRQQQKEVKQESKVTLDPPATTADDSGGGTDWYDNIRLDGDFRYRYETIDVEDSPLRRRNRIRARANIRTDVSDDIKVGFGLATGGDDPVSTNQTLGGGGSSKGVVLNLAYVDWSPIEDLHIYAGKFKNPIYRVAKQPLLFDGDWTPEGLAISYSRDWWFVNAIGTFLESDTRRSNDNFSWGGQLGARGEILGAEVVGGVSFFSMQTQGKSTNFGDPTDPGDFFGNTAIEPGGLACGTTPDVDCVFQYDYVLTELFAQATFDVRDWPTTVFADYVRNSDPSENNTAWSLGVRAGQAKDRGQFQLSYYYADKEADAVLGLLTDSDFAGGGTDVRGHFLNVNYGMSKNWTLGLQYFVNETDIAAGIDGDYNRLMLDTQWKWK